MLKLFDVTLRDGIQSRKFVPTIVKTKVLSSLVKAGHKDIEITSFTKLPQFSDKSDFLKTIERPSNVNYYGLIYNDKSYDQLRKEKVLNGLSLITSLSNNFSLKNTNRPAEKLFEGCLKVLSYNDINSRVYISHAFSEITSKNKLNQTDVYLNIQTMIESMLKNNTNNIAISDTIGEATPQSVGIMCRMLKEQFPEHTTLKENRFSFHFHGKPTDILQNIEVCSQYGFLSFDVSVVDGWCPYSGVKHGNTNTLDVIDFLERNGKKSQIDKHDIINVKTQIDL
jgi:isopropylmalate/homocitrate/citramalate synthase